MTGIISRSQDKHSQLAKIIDKTIRDPIMATRYRGKPRLRSLMQDWFIAHT